CAAYLKDGLYLPCVLLCAEQPIVDLALRRFDETRTDARQGLTYPDLVRTFVAGGNCINLYDVAKVEPSPYAIPVARLREIRGETTMSWTQFTVRMRDGKEFTFGTSFLREFFDMPAGYAPSDIEQIIPALPGTPRHSGTIYRERPFFECFVPHLV